jgi:hypothetical protein
MGAELKTFQKDWRRWSAGERIAMRIMVIGGLSGFIAQVVALLP